MIFQRIHDKINVRIDFNFPEEMRLGVLVKVVGSFITDLTL